MINLDTQQRITSILQNSPVVLFMKGTRERPACGFSATVVQILDLFLPTYTTVNVLEDDALRQGIKEHASWPTIPQLYVKGEFIGGCDILKEMQASGELFALLGVAKPQNPTPQIHVTPQAQAALQSARQNTAKTENLRLRINAQYQPALSLDTQTPLDLLVQQGDLVWLLDPLSACRASNVTVDYQEGPDGAGFDVQVKKPSIETR